MATYRGVVIGILAFIVLGLLAGAIAKLIMPGDDPGGFIVTTLIGIAGALIGGFLASALFGAHPLDEFFDVSTWLTAILGAIVLLALYRVTIGRRAGPGRVLRRISGIRHLVLAGPARMSFGFSTVTPACSPCCWSTSSCSS